MDKFQKHLSTGDVLLREGDPGACAYVVEHGKLEVSTLKSGRKTTLARVGPGGMVGEMALITGGEHTATVTAVEPTRLLRITRDYMEERLEASDPLLRHMLEVVLTRFRDVLKAVNGQSQDARTEQAIGGSFLSQTGDRARAMSNLQLRQQVEAALESGDLELHYQPIIRLDDHTIAGFEALIRWRKPGHDLLVPPNQFIPVIESSPLIVRVGHWIFDSSCADLKTLLEVAAETQPEAPPMTMSVNLAARQFMDPELFVHIRDALNRDGLTPELLRLEITESMVLRNWDMVQELLHRARSMGLKIAIDDFGTGYSSLAYLHRFPVDTLKLDRAFVRDMGTNPQSRAIVSAVLRLAQDLDMTLISEGVETREQARVLKAMGVNEVQGYYFGRPMPLGQAIEFLSRHGAENGAPLGRLHVVGC